MGNKNSGPRRIPTAVHKLRGTLRSNRTNYREPTPAPAPDSFDTPPSELNGDTVAVGEWVRVVPLLRRAGVISEAERSPLIAMCQQWSRYVAAHHTVRTIGPVIDGDDGPIVSPYVAIADKALTHCQKLWIELGCTPSGRSRMSTLVTVPPTPSKWAGLL
jgi:P27 family predicted phage terminase small subunit